MGKATMGRLFVVVCVCAAILGFNAGCNKAGEKKEIKKAAMTKEAIQEKKKAQAKTLKERKRYESYVGAKVRDFTNRVAVMKSKASQSTGRAKIQMDRNIRELEARLRNVRTAYRTLTSSKGTAWNAAKVETDRAINRFEVYYARVGR